MDIDPGVLIFVFLFIVLPLIQQFLEAGKKKGRGQRERQQQPPMAGRVPPPTRRPLPENRSPAPTSEQQPERAADLIPAELWEILTGERRLPPAPPPPPKPQLPPRAASPEADLDEELAQDEEAASVRATTNEDAAAAELLRRREKATLLARTPTREPARIVSLETEPLPEPLRHAAFHEQLKQTKTPVGAPPVFRHAMMVSLANRSDLKRAIILQEVLGPPKGLE